MTAEMVVLTPLLLLVVMFVVMLGRLETAATEVTDAARGAAQAAVVWPTSGQAYVAATETASYALHGDGITCSPYELSLDSAELRPGGELSVTVSCRVSYSQLAIPGIPGSRTLTSTVSAPVELYRSFG